MDKVAISAICSMVVLCVTLTFHIIQFNGVCCCTKYQGSKCFGISLFNIMIILEFKRNAMSDTLNLPMLTLND